MKGGGRFSGSVCVLSCGIMGKAAKVSWCKHSALECQMDVTIVTKWTDSQKRQLGTLQLADMCD